MAVFPALFGLLLAGLVSGQNDVEITPKEAVRNIGEEVEVLCKVAYPIKDCRVSYTNITKILSPDQPIGDVSYHGQGFEQGECGVKLRITGEYFNGKISCSVPSRDGSSVVSADMTLIVAKAPETPELLRPPQHAFKEGEVFTAKCVAPRARPAAKITWFLDNEPLLEGIHQPVITEEPNSDLVTISQNVSRPLTADDNARMLACRVEHQAMPQPYDSRIQLFVNFPPKIVEPAEPIATIFGLKLNEEGRLNVTVRADPQPQAVWSVGEHRLEAPQSTDDGFTALAPLHLGNGYYNVTLVLGHVTKELVERSYALRISNQLGTQDITLRVSTMEEPAGVALEAGQIVGIVIGVLVLIIAVSLAVFAFATDRWCFAGRRQDGNKSSGESTPAGDVLIESGKLNPRPSDTESAVGGASPRARLAALGARVRAALPRPRDKVQATEPNQEENKTQEDKVVYAQLALSEQPAENKPTPPSTEYAEIVYTDQPKENKEQ